jgi:hypothetical protein
MEDLRMSKQELIDQINSIIEKIDDEKVLQDMKDLINGVYKHYISGNWER